METRTALPQWSKVHLIAGCLIFCLGRNGWIGRATRFPPHDPVVLILAQAQAQMNFLIADAGSRATVSRCLVVKGFIRCGNLNCPAGPIPPTIVGSRPYFRYPNSNAGVFSRYENLSLAS